MRDHFTPGPWTYSKTSDQVPFAFRGYVVGKDGIAGFWTLVKASFAVDESRDSEMQANARLISAAPDLFEAMRDLIECIDQETGNGFISKVEWHNARAALAKAEGEKIAR